jgi:hypothetical protein
MVTEKPKEIDALNGSISEFVDQKSKLFSFLISPESYLLCASVLCALVATPLIVANGIAIHCVLTSCETLQEESNTFESWIVFEAITLFFLLTSGLTARSYYRIRREKNGYE